MELLRGIYDGLMLPPPPCLLPWYQSPLSVKNKQEEVNEEDEEEIVPRLPRAAEDTFHGLCEGQAKKVYV